MRAIREMIVSSIKMNKYLENVKRLYFLDYPEKGRGLDGS